MSFRPLADRLGAHNADYVQAFDEGDLSAPPRLRLAIVACMDARIDPLKLLGIRNGDAHTIRNAGGVITDDVIRSLCLSQRLLGTREIILVHHTQCGMQNLDEAALRRELQQELGVEPPWSLGAFNDPYQDVRLSIQRLRETPFVFHKNQITGYVYEVTNGQLHKVDTP